MEAGNATTCTVPVISPSWTGNNGNVVGYFFQDSAYSSLGHKAGFCVSMLGYHAPKEAVCHAERSEASAVPN